MKLFDLRNGDRLPNEYIHGEHCIITGNLGSGYTKKYYLDDYLYRTDYSEHFLFKKDRTASYFFNEKGDWHNTQAAAIIMLGYKDYYLNNECFGNQSSFTDKTWAKFAAKYIKMKVFY